jgi:YegS/Rv2252/BmrU family lipid kinase
MSKIAVIAHARKSLDGGLPALRRALERCGIFDPLWCEVAKSREAPKGLRAALKQGADVVFVWGGDGMVQRCADVVADSHAAMAILPAGTANLFASNLGIPKSIDAAVEIGLRGDRRKLDLGSINGERFAVMAGVGFDAEMIHDANPEMKRRFGRTAYVLAAAKNLRGEPFEAHIKVDGKTWFDGSASCVLFGNVGDAFAGLSAFEEARPDDGLLEIGIASPEGILEWGRTIARAALSDASRSPFVHTTRGRSIELRLDRKVHHELDGSERGKKKSFTVKVEPSAISVCVPASR